MILELFAFIGAITVVSLVVMAIQGWIRGLIDEKLYGIKNEMQYVRIELRCLSKGKDK